MIKYLPPARSEIAVGHFEKHWPKTPIQWLERLIHRGAISFRSRKTQHVAMVQRVIELRGSFKGKDLASEARLAEFQIRQNGLQPEAVAHAFALIEEALNRSTGFTFHDTQLSAGWYMVQGKMAEMSTGEGKTLTATLPAGLFSLVGVPVHVITVNDYLTERDCEEAAAVLTQLGFSLGVVTHEKTPEEKTAAYRCDVVYVTNKELVFDYLRDRDNAQETLPLTQQFRTLNERKPPLVKQLGVAIVDEADSVLIDEANIPLILTAPTDEGLSELMISQAIDLVGKIADSDWESAESQSEGRIRQDRLKTWIDTIDNPDPGWQALAIGEELINQAQVAQKRYVRDVHYIIEDDALVIVDENTGRPMPDRSLPWGLQQVLEIREGLAPSKDRRTLSKLSYQRYFTRYHHLVGMSGTLQEVKREISRVYRCSIAPIPTFKPVQRKQLIQRVFQTEDMKVAFAIERTQDLAAQGRAVLVGVTSVSLSEKIHQRLSGMGIENGLINARNLETEAEIIANAGHSGRVSVVTNMAGRGTDIKLSSDCRDAGGLHVIILDCLESARLDRQLFGRAGRQGDPGSFDILHSLDEKVISELLPNWLISMLQTLGLEKHYAQQIYFISLSWKRRWLERTKSKQRLQLMKSEDQRDDMLSFTRRT